MSISIAIPVYECHGLGWLYLSELLNSIAKQTYKNVEIVISDQSTDDKIKNLCSFYAKEMNIKYVSGHHVARSNSTNVNNAILHCSNDYIKIIFQDDFFINSSAIEQIVMAFNNGAKWIISGCDHCHDIHYLERPFIPYYTDQIIYGKNTISSPSVLAFYGKELFDEKLVMLMDCEMYKRLHDKYGEPCILHDSLVCNRLHDKQLQNAYEHVLDEEINYCLNKYKGA
jgi:glycosyltransferase involved in cell wall biosynthesis